MCEMGEGSWTPSAIRQTSHCHHHHRHDDDLDDDDDQESERAWRKFLDLRAEKFEAHENP